MIKLLFIDDEIGNRQAIKMIFKENPNYQLFLAGTGQEAIEITQKENPDLVILDMVIPDMAGEDVFKRLKEINPKINVIFLSGINKGEVAQKAKELGAKGFLTKPFDIFTLEDYLKKAVPEIY